MAEFSVSVVPATSTEPAPLLKLLGAAYSTSFSAAWFGWKHLAGPWGPSSIAIASDEEGPIGVVFGIPWVFIHDGNEVAGMRMVDGGTAPRAARQGVFRNVCRSLVEWFRAEHVDGIVLGTATEAAAKSHVTIGAIRLPPIRNVRRLVVPSTARLDAVGIDDLPQAMGSQADDGYWRTQWSGVAVAWLLGRPDGGVHRIVRLRQTRENHGVVVRRVVARGLPMVSVLGGWGEPDLRQAAVRAVCRVLGTPLVGEPQGPGTDHVEVSGVPRGVSHVCLWLPVGIEGPGAADEALSSGHVGAWSLNGLDLGGAL